MSVSPLVVLSLFFSGYFSNIAQQRGKGSVSLPFHLNNLSEKSL